jgi:hypothetical protein
MRITPGVGIGELRFGQTRDEVRRLLGPPDRIEEQELEGDGSEGWHYEEHKLSVYFDEDADWRLVMFDVDHPEAEVDGFHPIGVDEDAVLEVLDAMGEVVLEDELDDLDRRVYDLVGTGIWFWIHDDRCDSMQVSALLDDDEAFIWPADA